MTMAPKNNTTEAIGAKLANRSCFAGLCLFHHLLHEEIGLMVKIVFETVCDFIPSSLG